MDCKYSKLIVYKKGTKSLSICQLFLHGELAPEASCANTLHWQGAGVPLCIHVQSRADRWLTTCRPSFYMKSKRSLAISYSAPWNFERWHHCYTTLPSNLGFGVFPADVCWDQTDPVFYIFTSLGCKKCWKPPTVPSAGTSACYVHTDIHLPCSECQPGSFGIQLMLTSLLPCLVSWCPQKKTVINHLYNQPNLFCGEI